METTRPAITATGLSRTYGYRGGVVRAVCDVDLAVAAGSLTALVGPSGAGTSTLLQCLAGTDLEIAGRVLRHGALLPSGSPGGLTRLRRALVAALAQRPDVVVADEPTADLDAASAAVMIDAMGAVADRLGVTVVVATHDPRLAGRADRVLAMEAGSVVADSAEGAEGDSLSVVTDARAAAPQRRLGCAHP